MEDLLKLEFLSNKTPKLTGDVADFGRGLSLELYVSRTVSTSKTV